MPPLYSIRKDDSGQGGKGGKDRFPSWMVQDVGQQVLGSGARYSTAIQQPDVEFRFHDRFDVGSIFRLVAIFG